MAGEVEMLVLRQLLVGKDQHRVFGERVLDRLQVGRRQRRRQIDVADLGGKACVTGQTVMVMVVPPGFENFAGLNHNGAMGAIERCRQDQIGSTIKT